MLDRVVRKACNRLQLTDDDGNVYGIKLLNFGSSSLRTLRADRQAVTDADTTLVPGKILHLDDGRCILLTRQEPDVYRENIIRYTFDVIDPSHYVNIIRSILHSNRQGGLDGKSDQTVRTNMPVKIALRDNVDSKVVTTYKSHFLLLCSIFEDIRAGDRLAVSGGNHEFARVDSVIQSDDGTKEVWFDNDPRW